MRRSFNSRVLSWILLGLGLVGLTVESTWAETPTPFERMDRYALAAPDSAAASPASLAAYLIKPARNPWEKVRVIFRWITQHIDYDIDSLVAGNPVSADPEVVLRRRKAICGGYANLLAALCQEAGLESEVVRGQSREYGEENDELLRRLFGGPVNHAWNVVKLGGQWVPLDVTWGSGYLNGQHHFVRQFDPHYFLTRPVEFIHTHYPDDPKWQLLPRPIDRSTYDQLVHVRSGFFRDGLTLGSHRLMNIAAAGPLKITLGAPENVVLFATVERRGTKDSEIETLAQRLGQTYEIQACFPKPGVYYLRIFSEHKGSDRKDPSQWALGYKVTVEVATKGCEGYPTQFAGFFEHDAYLAAPMMAHLKSNFPVRFDLTVPGAEQVCVGAGDERIVLEKRGKQFVGSVALRPGELFLFAVFPGRQELIGLLKYAVE